MRARLTRVPPPLSSLSLLLVPQPRELSGWLEKRGDKGPIKLFKRRWFTLSNNHLIYKESESDAKILGKIDLKDALLIGDAPAGDRGSGGSRRLSTASSSSSNSLDFQVRARSRPAIAGAARLNRCLTYGRAARCVEQITMSNGRVYVLLAESDDSKRMWIEALRYSKQYTESNGIDVAGTLLLVRARSLARSHV